MATRLALATASFALIAALAPSVSATPSVQVHAAFDLFQTDPAGTHYGPLHFHGVKGCAAFAAAVNTDTVVERLDTATPASPVTRIEARCLQLQAEHVDAVDASPVVDAVAGELVTIGGVTLPVQAVFATLQSDRGRHPADSLVEERTPGMASVGTVTFTFDGTGAGGTFDSDLMVYFDIRAYSINGPIIYSADEESAPHFHSYATPWGNSAALNAGAFEDRAYSLCDDTTATCILTDVHRVGAPSDKIAGLNFLTNGVDGSADFFPMQIFS